MSEPMPYRIIRGEVADYAVEHFETEEARNETADAYAAEDGENVLCEVYDPETADDILNGGWGLDRVAYPPGQEPPELTEAQKRQRWNARAIAAGDDVTVFAHPVGQFGQAKGADVSGIVATVEVISLPFTTEGGRRIAFTDGRVVEAVGTGVTIIHDPDLNVIEEEGS